SRNVDSVRSSALRARLPPGVHGGWTARARVARAPAGGASPHPLGWQDRGWECRRVGHLLREAPGGRGGVRRDPEDDGGEVVRAPILPPVRVALAGVLIGM